MTLIAVALLFAVNLLFYGYLDRWNVLLLLVLTFVSFITIKGMSSRPIERRQPWLWLSVSTLLICLTLYKVSATYWGGALPLGISFFTFQLIGSLLDVSRGSMRANFSTLEYFTSVSFFPSIAAGPILRSQDFIPQLREKKIFDYDRAKWSLLLIANGLFKKKVADLLALTTETYLHQDGGAFAGWIGVVSLSAQFYADFSGYTDIAIGVASLLGFSIPENFHLPFLATSVAEHWRRWHISLYDWFRQYIFSTFLVLFWHDRKGWVRKISPTVYSALAIVATMALIGVWHAPTPAFLVWGVLNGLLVAASPSIANFGRGIFRDGWLAILLTFYLTAVLRVLNVLGVNESVHLWQRLHWPKQLGLPGTQLQIEFGLVLLALIVPHMLDATMMRWRTQITKSFWCWCWIAVLIVFVVVMGTHEKPFLYQQF